MRVLIVGQPATGLYMLTRLLMNIYHLDNLNALTDNLPGNGDQFAAFVDAGRFIDGSILTSHFSCADVIKKACGKVNCHIVSIVRDPFSGFEAMYNNANIGVASKINRQLLPFRGLGLESDEVLARIQDTYSLQLKTSSDWWHCDWVNTVLFEELNRLPTETLFSVCQKMMPVAREKICEAVSGEFPGGYSSSDLTENAASRLPGSVSSAISSVIPASFKLMGYVTKIPGDNQPAKHRMLTFSKFLGRYSDSQRVFIVGYGKSGTTWLHMIFFNHPNVAVVAERRLIEHPDGNVGLLDLLLDEKKFQSWFASSSFGISYPGQAGVRYELSRLISDYLMFRAVSMRSTAKGFDRAAAITHFSEKIALNTKDDAVRTIGSLKEIYPDALVIHIVRDPRDVAVSAMHHSYRNFKAKGEYNWLTNFIDSEEGEGPVKLIEKGIASDYFEDHAKSWSTIVSAFHDIGLQEYGDNYSYVRYEDMLENPRMEIKNIFESIGLEYTDDVLEMIVKNTSFKSLSQGRTSGQQDKSSFFRKGMSGDWKNYLSDKQGLQLFGSAKRLMDIFGYR